jgi:hypothetical protein
VLARTGASLLVACVAALAACGGAVDRRATIATALRKLEVEYVHAKESAASKPRGADVLGTIVDVYAPPPKGVTRAEWQRAIKNDRKLQREFNSPIK